MIGLVYCLINLLLFDIPLLYYYINFKSLIIYSLFSADIHFFVVDIFLTNPVFSVSLSTVSELFLAELFVTSAILSKILLLIKSLVASAV